LEKATLQSVFTSLHSVKTNLQSVQAVCI
jgi:hypothetical protein